MVYFSTAATFLFALASGADASLRSNNQSNRRLSYELIAGYEPRSSVTDHNAIDLDQQMMESQLAMGTTQSYEQAKKIYTEGAHSKSIAAVTLTSGLLQAVPAGTQVSGTSVGGAAVVGKTLKDYSVGDTSIQIQYQTTDKQATYVGCQVGGSAKPNTQGCFEESGSLTVEGQGSYEYTYDVLTNNTNGRTLQGFSTAAKEKMFDCPNCPYVTYEKFYAYYGAFDYADQWVMAAFDRKSTNFANGNANFQSYDFVGRTEAIKKGTVFLNVWMYVIREMEDALDDCKEQCTIENCNDDPVHAWDEAVAFYSGSLEGKDGSGDGVFLHQLADKRCENFRTCGDLADESSGLSHVNIEIFRQFSDGLGKLLRGECSAVRANKERIEQLMAVPLIQGALRYAYITDKEANAGEKAEAEGATFAAGVLPLVHACNEEAAETIYTNLKTGQGGTANFDEVKRAFESTYECLNIRCEDIGGLFDSALREYMEGAAPCGSSAKSDKNVGLIVGLSVGGIVLLGLVVVAFNRSRSQKEY